MTWDVNHKRASGRTTRMLEYAAVLEQQTVVVALTLQHAEQLYAQYISIAGAKPDPKFVRFMSFNDLVGYDWATGRSAGHPVDCEILVDHSVMSSKLTHVLHYLKSVERVNPAAQWLANTAMALTSLGRKVYIIADKNRAASVEVLLQGYPQRISIEDGSMMGNLNWLDLSLRRAHPNCQPLFDPETLRRRFKASLDLIHRWDA